MRMSASAKFSPTLVSTLKRNWSRFTGSTAETSCLFANGPLHCRVTRPTALLHSVHLAAGASSVFGVKSAFVPLGEVPCADR